MAPNQTVIELCDIAFSFEGKRPGVSSKLGETAFQLFIQDFSLYRGEKLLLLGPSGSGKSTLLNLITGTLTPQSGQVVLLGQNMKEKSKSAFDKFRADHMGVIFQLFNLVPFLSVIENVLLPLSFSKSRADRAGATEGARKQKAIELLAALGVDPALQGHKRAADLSVGQQQRVAAARALIGAPQMIIADEPTSSLDQGRRQNFLDLLFQELDMNGTSLLMVSHDETLKQYFDRSIYLEDIIKKGAS